MTGALTDAALAVLFGGLLGAGLWSMLAALPRWSAPSLMRRVAPYIRDITDPAGTTLAAPFGGDPAAGILSAVRALLARARRSFARILGSTASTDARLSSAGWHMDAETFRGRQFAVSVGAGVVGGLVAVLVAMSGRGNAMTPALPLVFAAVGFVASDMWLTRAVRRRRERIQDELPTVLEFLAVCLAAGESLTDALRRASRVGSGALCLELRRVMLEVSTGSSLADALAAFARRLDTPAVSRAVDQLVAAIERGAPVAAVLRDQASDAREDQKRTMLEQAGKKEIAMLLPRNIAKRYLTVVCNVPSWLFAHARTD